MPKDSGNKVDLVYILGNESTWDDREIRYSIRSAEKHLKNFRKVFIVGRKPLFFGDQIIEIPCDDIYINKARNIMRKILVAANDHRVMDNFILFNDDYFLLKDTDAITYPYYWKCTLEESVKLNQHNSDYLPHVEATYNALKERGLPLLNFDTHYPIIYNKRRVRKVCAAFNWNIPAGYIFKSLYCNFFSIPGEQIRDCKINHSHIYWAEALRNLSMFSIGDRSINKSLLSFLNELFHTRSRFETGLIP